MVAAFITLIFRRRRRKVIKDHKSIIEMSVKDDK